MTIPFQLIIGSASTGKTNILRILLRQFQGNRIFISDSQAADLHEFSGKADMTYISSPGELKKFMKTLSSVVGSLDEKRTLSGKNQRDFIMSEPPVFVLIDDLDNFIDITKSVAADLEPLVKQASNLGVVFIATITSGKMKGYDGITALFKSPQAAIALGNPEDAAILLTGLRAPRGYKASPEFGFWYKRGEICRIKIPYVE